MARKELIEYLSDKLNIERKELLEKDVILQILLIELYAVSEFHKDFAFKGGTCLIKCYLGYYRFSEDLDFTYLNQKEFSGKSEKQIRKMLSGKIDAIAAQIQAISGKHGFDFKGGKHNKRYAELGGSNKFATFKIWYTSAVLGIESFVKVQINFVEKLMFPVKDVFAKSLIEKGHEKEIMFLFPEYSFLLKLPKVKAYDLREICAEKVRAILTRKGIKARDFVDLFMIYKENGIDARRLEEVIADKTKFMLKYEKYSQNLLAKEFGLNTTVIISEEKKLMLKPIGGGFELFLRDLEPFLKRILLDLKE